MSITRVLQKKALPTKPINFQLAGEKIRQVGILFLWLMFIPFISLIGYLLPIDIKLAQAFLYIGALTSFALLIWCAVLLIEAGENLRDMSKRL
jgi:hypothetical protein